MEDIRPIGGGFPLSVGQPFVTNDPARARGFAPQPMPGFAPAVPSGVGQDSIEDQLRVLRYQLDEILDRMSALEDEDPFRDPGGVGGGTTSLIPTKIFYNSSQCALKSSPESASYSSSTPFLWVDIPNLTYEWKSTRVGADPDTFYVRDYSIVELHLGAF